MNKREEKFYEIAAKEIAGKTMVPALAAKAFSDADGDERKTLARYIKLRVEQLESAWLSEVEQSRRAEDERQRVMRDAAERAGNQSGERPLDHVDVASLKALFSRYSTAKLLRMYARRGKGWYRPEAEFSVKTLLSERSAL